MSRREKKKTNAGKGFNDPVVKMQGSDEGVTLQRESNIISRRGLLWGTTLTVALGVPAFVFGLLSELRAQGEHEAEFPPKEGRGVKIVEASYSARSTTYCSDQVLSLDVFTALPLGSAGGLLVQEKLGMTVVGRGLLAFTAESQRRQTVITGIRAEVARLGNAPKGTVYQTVPEGGMEEEAEILYAGIIASNADPKVRVLDLESLGRLGKVDVKGNFPDVQINLGAFESRTIRIYISCQRDWYAIRMWLKILADGQPQEISITDAVGPVRIAGLARDSRNIFKEDVLQNNARSVKSASISEVEGSLPVEAR